MNLLNIDFHRTSQRTHIASPLDRTIGLGSWDNNRCSWRQSCFRQKITHWQNATSRTVRVHGVHVRSVSSTVSPSTVT